MYFMFRPEPNKSFVTDAPCLEDALVKAFGMNIGSNVEVIECPERIASTHETREILYGNGISTRT